MNACSDLLRQSAIAGGTAGDPAAVQRHAVLLLARSAAYSALSERLRSVPASQVRSPLRVGLQSPACLFHNVLIGHPQPPSPVGPLRSHQPIPHP